ncbi:hypothetical protein O3Q51_18380, partial [Cryomorphaceae bacterium 1068]|nr:hypothetical protein [Cryomorphaceae bacterium 1068]
GEATLLPADIDGGSADNCSVESLSILGSPADVTFDQNATPDILFGDGNANGAFTTDSDGSIELALRAKVRFPSPASVYNSNGDGSYNHAVGAFGTGGIQSGWNFEWSVNTDADGTSGLKLSDLTYEIGIDFDPSDGVNFVEFDPINQPFADHAIGDNSTLNGDGAVAADPTAYASLIAANNVAQNSWRNNFFGAFDGNVDGRYEVYLKAFDGGGNEVAMTAITVIAGAGTGNAYAGCLSPLESLDYDCSNVGVNPQILLVRDATGNEATCTAQVTVEDNIAPEALC